MTSSDSSLLGKSIRHFRIIDRLGRGGMGSVYVAFDTKLERKVALKVLHPERNLDPDARHRFQREARLLSRMTHPNVCQLHDFFEENGVQYLLMEYVEGERLGQEHRALPFQDKLDLAFQVASVLRAGHGQGILHRDLKPDNILVRQGVAKVLDFGLARLLEDEIPTVEIGLEAADSPAESPVQTQFGRVLGTPSYMSPEQANGEPVSAASDQFAFGQLLHFLFSDEPAYDPGLSPEEIIEQAAKARPRPPVGVRADVDALIRSLQEADPQLRPSATETMTAIRAAKVRNQRRLMVAAAAALVLAFAGGVVKYTVDLRRERAEAVAARAAAEQARAESDATAEFLTEVFRLVRPLSQAPEDQRTIDMLEAARKELISDRAMAPVERARLLHVLGDAYGAMEARVAAAQLYAEAEVLRRESLGVDHPDRALSLLKAAAMRRSTPGQAEEVLADYLEAESILRRVRDQRPAAWGLAIDALLGHDSDHKQFEQAELRIEEALPWLEAAVGRESSTWLSIALHKAALYGDSGRQVESLRMRRELDPLVNRVYALDNPTLIRHRLATAHKLRQQGQLQEAQDMIRAEIERIEPNADPNHEVLSAAYSLLATALDKLGRHVEAVEASRRAFLGTRARAGENSVETAFMGVALGHFLDRAGRHREAEREIRLWLPLLREHYGERGFFTLEAYSYLRQALVAQGREEEAASLPSIH